MSTLEVCQYCVSIFADVNRRVFYRLSAFGKVYSVNVSANRRLVSPEFDVDYWNNSAAQHSTLRTPDVTNCYYVGYVVQQEVTSRVALSTCNGLVRDATSLMQLP